MIGNKIVTHMGKNTYTHITASEAIKTLEHQSISPDYGYGLSSQRTESKGGDWYHTENTAQYLDLYKYGWREGREELQTNIDTMSSQSGITFDVDVVGFMPSVPDYLAGLPDNMWTSEPEARKFVHLLVPFGWSAGVSGTHILKYAGVIVSIFKAIRDSGIGCSIDLVMGNQPHGNKGLSAHRITVCDVSEVVDIDKIASCFHASFFRRVCFALIETSAHKGERDASNGGYGYIQESTHNKAIDMLMSQTDEPFIKIPALDPQLWQDGDPSGKLEATLQAVRDTIAGRC